MTARVLPLMLIILTLGLGTVQAEAIDIVDNTAACIRNCGPHDSDNIIPAEAHWREDAKN